MIPLDRGGSESIDRTELQIDTYNAAIPDPIYYVRVTHKPSGYTTKAEDRNRGLAERRAIDALGSTLKAAVEWQALLSLLRVSPLSASEVGR